MDTVAEVMAELEKKGSEQTRKTYRRHGAPETMFGVKVGDLKPLARKIKGRHELACALYDTGNADAMYLACMVADGARMTKRQLQSWATKASWYMVSEYAVPGVVVESAHARELALKWMDSRKESVAACGWCTYAGLMAVQSDGQLDLDEIKQLLERVVERLDGAPNRVRYAMNGFVIAVGAYVRPLLKQAKDVARKIGRVSVDMGDTACQVPVAADAIAKIEQAGRVGSKRKTVRC